MFQIKWIQDKKVFFLENNISKKRKKFKILNRTAKQMADFLYSIKLIVWIKAFSTCIFLTSAAKMNPKIWKEKEFNNKIEEMEVLHHAGQWICCYSEVYTRW